MTRQKMGFARWMMIVVLTVALLTSTCLAVFASAEAEPQTRDFNEAFDRILDGGKGAGAEAAYRSIAWEAGKCDDVTDPIFKVGSPKISAGFESLNIEVRSTDESVKLADLKIGLRTADSDDVATANSWALDHEDMIGGITLSAGTDIGADWVTISIDFTSTDIKVNGNAFDSTAPDAMLAFHLYAADNTKAGKLDIRKVSVTTGATETVVMDFDGIYEAWWNGGEAGTFADIPQGYAIADSKDIASDDAKANNLDEAYSAIVLNIAGSGAVSVAPILEDGTAGTAKAWADLTDLAGTPVAALDGTYRNAVISLESLGATKIKGVRVSVSEGKAFVAGAFFSNLESIAPDKHFPVLDMDSIAYLSQFDFEYLTAGPDYDKAVEECAPFNCDYILSYSTKNNVIKGGHLVLDAQGEAFTSIKIRSKVASEGRKYLVLKYKLQNGATLNDFRFDVLKTDGDSGVGIKYANQFVVGNALPSLSEANPYAGTNGYSYLVIDLERTFGERYISGVDMYFSGEGQLLIDEIFYAHPVVKEAKYSDNILTDPIVLNVTDAEPGYQYLGWLGEEAKAHDGIELVMKGSEGYSLADVRIEMGGHPVWFAQNDGGTFHDIYGRMMPALTTENQVYTIDFANSGISGAIGAMHVHGSPVVGGATLTIESIRFIDYEKNWVYTEEILAEDFTGKEVVATDANLGYAYIGWVNGSLAKGNKYMIMEVEGDLTGLRIGFPEGIRWIVDNPEGSLKGLDGNLLPTSGAQTLVIDLAKSGITNLGDIHIHHTFANVGDVLKIKSVKFADEKVEMITTEEVLADDFGGKELVATDANKAYAYVGWINGSLGKGYDYMVMEVEGDLTQLRIEFAGSGIRWIAENAEGSLKDANGNLFPTSGAQTLVIDLEKSGIADLGDIHVHHGFANVGDVLKIKSVKFSSKKVGYEDIQMPINDDTAPEISATVPETGVLGTEIALSATATDNYGGDVEIAYEVLLGTEVITLTEGKFTPAKAGTYSVKVTATDAAGNVATQTLSITVSCTHADANHDGKCDKCEETVEIVHDPADANGKCPVCSACLQHKDAGHDGKCDNCQATVEIVHDAADANGKCPTCSACLQHKDAAHDGKCDNCQATVEIVHGEPNEEGKCPVCGAVLVEDKGLGAGAIVLIVLGSLAVVCGGVVAVIFIRKKKLAK
ncbi:MAG: hypothetical protein IJF66_03960 [Clostridia bacterium]|nr:hypothetical protein [Clostridia bacterium]